MDCTTQTIFISGIGRSGTTWLSNIINYDECYRDVFEPLHPTEGISHAQTFKNYEYLSPDLKDDNKIQAMREVLCAVEDTPFTLKYNKAPLDASRLLKSIRLHLSLKWVRVNFPQMPMIYIVRHPASVVQSQLRAGWGKYGRMLIKRVLDNETVQREHLAPFQDELNRASTDFQRHLLLWCCTQYIILRQFEPDEMLWVFYNDLITDPHAEARRIFDYLERDFDQDALAKVIKKPSATTMNRFRKKIAQGKFNQGDTGLSWRDYDYLQRMLDRFGLQELVTQTSEPSHKIADKLLVQSIQPQQPSRSFSLQGLERFMNWSQNKFLSALANE